jgi:hypothetical protein
MKRFHQISISAGILLLLWLAVCTLVSRDKEVPGAVVWSIYTLPVSALAAYGLYAFILLVHGVLTFRTVPSEAEKLRADIDEALTFLRQRGISWEQAGNVAQNVIS